MMRDGKSRGGERDAPITFDPVPPTGPGFPPLSLDLPALPPQMDVGEPVPTVRGSGLLVE